MSRSFITELINQYTINRDTVQNHLFDKALDYYDTFSREHQGLNTEDLHCMYGDQLWHVISQILDLDNQWLTTDHLVSQNLKHFAAKELFSWKSKDFDRCRKIIDDTINRDKTSERFERLITNVKNRSSEENLTIFVEVALYKPRIQEPTFPATLLPEETLFVGYPVENPSAPIIFKIQEVKGKTVAVDRDDKSNQTFDPSTIQVERVIP